MGSIYQKDITFIDIYAPNIGERKIHKANINGPKREKWKQYNKSRGFLTPHLHRWTCQWS